MSVILDFRGQEKPILKTRIISVGYNMVINNLFVLLIHQVHVPEIPHLMTFHDLRTMAILDVDLQTRN